MHKTAYNDMYIIEIMGWGISNSMSKQWCTDVLVSAIAENRVPEIINSDHGKSTQVPCGPTALKLKASKYQ